MPILAHKSKTAQRFSTDPETNKPIILNVVSVVGDIICPECGTTMKHYDDVMRKLRDIDLEEMAVIRHYFLIPRYQCKTCKENHKTHIQRILIKNMWHYKHYSSRSIQNCIDGMYLEEDELFIDGFPCAATLAGWNEAFAINATMFEEFLEQDAVHIESLEDSGEISESETETDGNQLAEKFRHIIMIHHARSEDWLDHLLLSVSCHGLTPLTIRAAGSSPPDYFCDLAALRLLFFRQEELSRC